MAQLVLIASFLCTPVVWFAMDKWLAQFAYRVDLSWWLFVVPAMITLLIALTTTGYQAIKAGLANPVKSLRSE